MLKNYFTIAFRNFWRHKLFTLINVFGLAIGISASLVIYLIVHHEFSFDQFQKDKDSIYRVVTDTRFAESVFRNQGVPGPLPAAVQNEVTGLSEVAAFHTFYRNVKVSIPQSGQKTINTFRHQDDIIFADNHFFNLFVRQWLAGSPEVLEKDPYQVVLTESRAKIYFPHTSPSEMIGREIWYNDSVKTVVAGVVKDITEPSDLNYEEFISLSTIKAAGLDQYAGINQWDNIMGSSLLFVKTMPGVQPVQINRQLTAISEKYTKEIGDGGSSISSFKVQPLSSIHFDRDYGGDGNKQSLYGLMLLAVFLLLLGAINFINLSTAQAAQRAKEIGIRKTMGSSKRQLIFQFLSETFLMTIFATALSMLLTPLLLNVFRDFIPAGLHFSLQQQPSIGVFLLILTLMVTILAGFYPALILSGFKPVTVLKNQSSVTPGKTRTAWLRRSLTVSQFIIAQILIIATLVVGKQIQYSLHKDLGLQKEAIINMRTPFDFFHPDNKRFVLLNKLKAIPEIALVSLGSNAPLINGEISTVIEYRDGQKEVKADVQQRNADPNYIHVYHIPLVAGEDYTESDTMKAFLINQTLAKQMGFQNPQQAVGEYVNWDDRKIRIAGVMADFHTKSMRSAIRPLVLFYDRSFMSEFHIALRSNDGSGNTWKNAIAKIEKEYKAVYPESDFSYSFFHKTIENLYNSDRQLSRLLAWATGLAIFISCLGLLGLAIYTANRRAKEIGIRKVLGASVVQIVSLLSTDFVRLLVLAFVIATPVAWWVAHSWLENFVYRTDLSWWIFVEGAAGILLITLMILSIQTIRSASANPVESLRTE